MCANQTVHFVKFGPLLAFTSLLAIAVDFAGLLYHALYIELLIEFSDLHDQISYVLLEEFSEIFHILSDYRRF